MSEYISYWDKKRFMPKKMECQYDHFLQRGTVQLTDEIELYLDEDFKTIDIDVRGYTIAISLGNTKDWKTKSTCGGFDEAIQVQVFALDNILDEDALIDEKFPTIEIEES